MGLFEYYDGLLHVPEELVDEKHPLKYKPFDNFEFMKLARVEYEGGRGELSLKAYCGVWSRPVQRNGILVDTSCLDVVYVE